MEPSPEDKSSPQEHDGLVSPGSDHSSSTLQVIESTDALREALVVRLRRLAAVVRRQSFSTSQVLLAIIAFFVLFALLVLLEHSFIWAFPLAMSSPVFLILIASKQISVPTVIVFFSFSFFFIAIPTFLLEALVFLCTVSPFSGTDQALFWAMMFFVFVAQGILPETIKFVIACFCRCIRPDVVFVHIFVSFASITCLGFAVSTIILEHLVLDIEFHDRFVYWAVRYTFEIPLHLCTCILISQSAAFSCFLSCL